MNGPDQAFISAYCDDWQATDESAAEPESPQAPDRDVKRAAGGWYRVDAGQQGERIPAPHVDSPESATKVGEPVYSVEISTWDMTADLPSDEALVSMNFLPCALPAKDEEVEESNDIAPEADAEVSEASHPEPHSAEKALPETLEVTAASRKQSEDGRPTAQQKELKPIWEVDRLSWPSDADRLYKAETDYFEHAGNKLREACQEGLRVLGIASAKPREGCTTLAICLARAAAAAGIKVALMDACLNEPKLAARLGMKFPHGWQEAAVGVTPLSETAIASIEDSVIILPLSRLATDEPFALDDPKVTQLIHEVAESVDMVVIDMGDIGPESTLRFERGENCPLDAAIVVRDLRHTARQQTLAVATGLKESGVEAVGIAENYARHESAAQKAAA